MGQEMFGHYRLDNLLGRGGMGEVWRAFDTVKGREVALKRLPPQLTSDPGFQARFRAEASLVARLHEPHIIPVHDYGELDGRLYLDMRLVEGRDLSTVLAEDGPLPLERAVNVIGQVAAALDVAHAQGLVHRDIKPSNILITPGGGGSEEFAYLADFGIARVVGSGSASLTATGATIGSLEYMAPERFTSGHGDHLVDVYALGCLLFEALTAHKPFEIDGLPAIINAHLSAPPPKVSDFVSAVREIDGVVDRGMAKDPSDRYPSAGALAAAARAVLTAGHSQLPPHGRRRSAETVVGAFTPRTLLLKSDDHGSARNGSEGPTGRGASKGIRTLAIAGLILAAGIIILAGVARGAIPWLHSGGSGSPGTGGSSSGQAIPPTASRATATYQPSTTSPDQLVSFVEQYYAQLPNDPASAWTMLSSSAQGVSGSFNGYQRFWSGVESVSFVEGPSAVSDDTVAGTLRFVRTDGAVTVERYHYVVASRSGGNFMIAAFTRG